MGTQSTVISKSAVIQTQQRDFTGRFLKRRYLVVVLTGDGRQLLHDARFDSEAAAQRLLGLVGEHGIDTTYWKEA